MIAPASTFGHPAVSAAPASPPPPPPIAAPAPVALAPLPRHISPSAAKSYLACSLRFWFERVAGIRKPTTPALHLGKAVHAALQSFHLARWRGGDDSPEAARPRPASMPGSNSNTSNSRSMKKLSRGCGRSASPASSR